MRILAVESSTDWLSVAAGDGSAWHARQERAGVHASERMLPLVREVLGECAWSLRTLDGIAFGAGPGAFTGVRIACGVAQGLALGTGLPVIGIASLLALAQGAWRRRGAPNVLACLDARMREVYVAAYQRTTQGWQTVSAPAVCKPDEVVAPAGEWHACGDAFAVYPWLAGRLALTDVDATAYPDARDVAVLALPRFEAGEGLPPDAAEPLYVRQRVALTTAERNAGARL